MFHFCFNQKNRWKRWFFGGVPLFIAGRGWIDYTILHILNITSSDIDKYQFILTGDFLILFATRIIIEKERVSDDAAIVKAIKFIEPIVNHEESVSKKSYSNLTKSKAMFDKVKDELYRSYSRK